MRIGGLAPYWLLTGEPRGGHHRLGSLGTVSRTALLHELVALLPQPSVVLRDRGRWIVAANPDRLVIRRGPDSLDVIDELTSGWWAGWLTYEAGHDVEPVVANPARRRPWPGGDETEEADAVWARFPSRVELPDDGEPVVLGDGQSAAYHAELIAEAAGRASRDTAPWRRRSATPPDGDHDAGPLNPSNITWRSSLSEVDYGLNIRRILEYIRAGTCYQTNLTRTLWTTDDIDPAAIFHELLDHHPAQYGSLIRLDGTTIVSGSPEQLVRQFGRWVQTRPIKGTDSDPQRLMSSTKDHAENVMIVDMARNDLGRVSEYGTVRVPSLFALEPHPGLFHLVSTVVGETSPGTSRSDVIRALFPAASITGAPKPRVMQIIEDLEPWKRGVYCGSVGWIDADHDSMDLSVAIRTFVERDGVLRFGVGGGVVADSRPTAEWQETELKAARFLDAARSARIYGTGRYIS